MYSVLNRIPSKAYQIVWP